jgi:alkyldihydroxyacetonephosphate synthase
LAGGVLLDLCGLSGIVSVDNESLVVEVLPGTFGDALEAELREQHGLTCGHWPQSMTLATVGGWVACRGAGQFSTRYGKIEDMVVGLTVVLADGTVVETGGTPRAAMGPDLNHLFIGSEGTLGVITSVRLRVHPAPRATLKAGYSVDTFATGLDLFRRILRAGATPAVLRLYDGKESDRNYSIGTDRCAIAVLDEGEPEIIAATMAVVEREAAATEGMVDLGESLVDHWLTKRNDVSQLEPLIQGGIVVDTMEVSGPWSVLADAYEAGVAAMEGVEGCLIASAHCSHSYLDGACLYFTFAAKPAEDSQVARDDLHHAVWDAGQAALLAAGTSVSHHHGIGVHRGPYLRESLGAAHTVLADIKAALDPKGILNPGKLGLA